LLALLTDLCRFKAIGHIYAKSGENEKAIETFKKVTRIDPKDHQVLNHGFGLSLSCFSFDLVVNKTILQAFVELGELLVESDWAAAMEYLKTVSP
jgi:RNA polymerase-associated protein CTR9